ncbi:unnamed protein product [Parajaminaea phylloscopi]
MVERKVARASDADKATTQTPDVRRLPLQRPHRIFSNPLRPSVVARRLGYQAPPDLRHQRIPSRYDLLRHHTMASNPNMDALLKWSVKNQDGSGPSSSELADDIKAGKRPDLDPKVLDAIMGKSEAQMMQEELTAAVDSRRSEEDRETALDNFEMLIESIDNANLISSMKMWQPLLGLLGDASPRLQTATLWILGTAVQNNPSAQDALLHAESPSHSHPLDAILALLRDSHDMGVRAKAMYAISGLLGHHPKAVREFESRGGFDVLRAALRDPSINLRRKVAFFVNSLLAQDDSAAQAASSQPLLIGGPSPSSSTAPVSGPPSAARAVAPVGNTAPAPNSGPAPFEKPAPTTTAASGVVHPSIPAALIRSGLLTLLVTSLLPASSLPQSLAADESLAVPELGPDGDAQEARADEDYAEKALRSLSTFAAKYEEAPLPSRAALPADIKQALRSLREEMDPSTSGGDRLWDWKRLNLDQAEWDQFSRGVERIAA